MVDFGAFKTLIDGIGGIDVNVPEQILSNRFDCPYKTQARCRAVAGLALPQGRAAHERHQALIYSRIRENQLNPADSDITRALRQQQVMQQTLSKLASAGRSSASRSTAASCSRRSPPTSRRGSSCSSAG